MKGSAENWSFPSTLLESQVSSQPLAKRLILNFFHQSFLSRDAYDRATRPATVAQSSLHSDNSPPSGSGHGVSRVARCEGSWVHLTVTKRARTSCDRPATVFNLYTWLSTVATAKFSSEKNCLHKL